tara:strand:+ start:2474 stop:2737 length:264 start_codon:yes stop_codon:yes gene_type:complete
MRQRKTHRIKTVDPFYCDVLRGDKKAEIRRHDRDYRIGDILVLQEYDPETGDILGDYAVRITGVVTWLEFPEGLKPFYSMLSIEPMY